MIADQNSSAGNQQAVELRIKLWDTARMAELVHRLQGDDQIEAGGKRRSPVVLFEIQQNKNGPVLLGRGAADTAVLARETNRLRRVCVNSRG